MKTFDIQCLGYSVKADIYEGQNDGPVLLNLIGRTSNRRKPHYVNFSKRLADELGVTSLVFDYSGHGDSPFELNDIRPAEHFLEVINAFDWLKQGFPNRKIIVIGSSYGGFMATQLTKYGKFDQLILRAPAIYRPQDFYTKIGDWDHSAIDVLRKDSEELLKHPLLARASDFEGKVLLVVHTNDEIIHKETTDAYAKTFRADVISEVVSHSLDDATPQQIEAYFNDIYGWLSSASA